MNLYQTSPLMRVKSLLLGIKITILNKIRSKIQLINT
jgi:hypothetical protein